MLWWIAQNIAVTLALVVIVWSACRSFRIGPVGRHALWLVVLLKMLTPPLVAWPWAVGEPVWVWLSPPLAPASDSSSVGMASQPPSPATTAPNLGAALVIEETPLAAPIVIVLPDDATAPDPAYLPVPIAPAAVVEAAPPTPPAASAWPVAPSIRLLQTLAAAWVAGSLLFLAVQVVRARRMIRLVRQSEPVDGSLHDCVVRLSRRLGIEPVEVVQVAGLNPPAIWCLGRPVLLWPARLPAAIASQSIQGLVLHELAHVRRRDHWVGWVELLAGVIWWWNPLFWYVRHQVRENAELACDGWVVDVLPGGRRAYAEGLLSVCEFMSRRPAPMPAVGVNTGGRRFLERRLAMIMKERIRLRLPRLGLITIGLLAMTALPAWSKKPDTTLRLTEPAGERVAVEEFHGDIGSTTLRGYGERSSGAERSREETLRQELISTLEQLKAQAVAAGRTQEAAAIDARILALQAETNVGLTAYRGRNGRKVRLPIVGQTHGVVWGGSDNIYTDDSTLAAAAVHAGVLQPGQQGTVEVEILPGQPSYPGLTRNGITSSSYQSWDGSYRIIGLAAEPNPYAPAVPTQRRSINRAVPLPQPAQNPLLGARSQVGNGKLVLVLVEVVGATTGSVWGDGVYTDDSSVAAAAVHAGLIKPGQRATVVVQVLPGRDSYVGSTRNGVTSGSYNSWDGSFQLLGVVEKGAGVEAASTDIAAWRFITLYGNAGNVSTSPLVANPEVSSFINQVRPTETLSLAGTRVEVQTAFPPAANPGNLTSFRGRSGTSLFFAVTGVISGHVWGDGIYTDDSDLATAAVHAGILKVGETGLVRVTIKPGQDSYAGRERNGVSSRSYGAWAGSYCIERADAAPSGTPDPQ